ncbi:hypothetical protein EF294_19910 [Gordonia oryzae]|uniref:DUF6779 domain-containing protein n=1 Tax=Gordonia oryzae TaxID=2487349 RepID=A0A3N4G3P5_9ACTN|nr:DUF6779 domain-containing protein [Gordonia oryzae]RPA56985.1 hypothetical protein EF294_19910 [Gordonia oryzae]
MTTSTGRSSDTRRAGRSVGQWLLGLLVVLALAASILMIFTGNRSIPGSLAVIAALWAAVIGAIGVTRFRKQAETAEAKSRDLRLVYELQLEREIAARRQYELDVETTIRKEVAAESGVELASLKEQVISLRASLERLLGETLPDDQVALPNEKLRELASGLGGGGLDPHQYVDPNQYVSHSDSGRGDSAFGGLGGAYGAPGFAPDQYRPEGFGAADFHAPDDGLVAARDFAETVPAADDGRHVERKVDPNEMTEVIPIVTDDPLSGRFATSTADHLSDSATSGFPERSGHGQSGHDQPGPGQVAHQRSGHDAVGEPAAFVDETPTDEWDRTAPEMSTPGSAAETPVAWAADASGPNPARSSGRHETAGAASTTAFGGGGRRRRPEEQPEPVAVDDPADDSDNAHSNGLPVSELLKQLRDTDAAGGGRRRRRD